MGEWRAGDHLWVCGSYTVSKWGFTWGDPDDAWWGVELEAGEVLIGQIFGAPWAGVATVVEREVCTHVYLLNTDLTLGPELPYVIGGSRSTNLLQDWIQRDEVTIQLLDVDQYYSTGAGRSQIAPHTMIKLVQETKTAAGNDTRGVGVYRLKSNPDITEDATSRVLTVKANEWPRYPMNFWRYGSRAGGEGDPTHVPDIVDLIALYWPHPTLAGMSSVDLLAFIFRAMGGDQFPVYTQDAGFPNPIGKYPADSTVTVDQIRALQRQSWYRFQLPPPYWEQDVISIAQGIHPLVWYDGDGGVHITSADNPGQINGLEIACNLSGGSLLVPAEYINREMSPPQNASVDIIRPRTYVEMLEDMGIPIPQNQPPYKGTVTPRHMAGASARNERYPQMDLGESRSLGTIDEGRTVIPMVGEEQYYADWLMHQELAKADQIRVNLDSGFPFNTIGQEIRIFYPPIAKANYRLVDVNLPFDESPQSWTLQWHRDVTYDHSNVIAP
jgi:hypothetical protein